MPIENEGPFDVVTNVDNELLFCVKARMGVPDTPRLFYDGSDRAVLRRDRKRSIRLEYLPRRTQKLLRHLETVLIAEIMDDQLQREYDAIVTKVRSLPE
jgi:hypothetical protein